MEHLEIDFIKSKGLLDEFPELFICQMKEEFGV